MEAANTDIDSNVEDRISKLPEHILSRILSSFDLKSAAKTCLLSKAWRYSWCTRSGLVFIPDPALPLSVLDKILQSYIDRNLRLEQFKLWMWEDNVNVDSDEVDSLLHKWIPIIIHDMRVESIDLTFNFRSQLFQLPSLSLILESDNNNIRNLSLLRCKFRSTTVRVGLKRLQTLWLYDVHIPEGILDSILSNCPSIENVSLFECRDFKGVKLSSNKPLTNLASFCFQVKRKNGFIVEIGDDMPSLETIELENCWFSVSRNKPLEYARLTRLSLTNVEILSGSFSCNLHSLEELRLEECFSIKELKVSSRSMKRLEIRNVSRTFEATIDAPSIVEFSYEGFLPQSISFAGRTTCSDELWKSKINLLPPTLFDPHQYFHWFDELYDLLNALSQSEISLELDHIDHIGGVPEEAKLLPVVAVEHLRMIRISERSVHYNVLFHVLRPNLIYACTGLLPDSNINAREIGALLLEERERILSDEFLQRVLEGVSLQALYRNQSQWQPIEHTSFAELSKEGADRVVVELRLHLKWRD